MFELWELFLHKAKTDPWHIASDALYVMGSMCFLAGTVIGFIQGLKR